MKDTPDELEVFAIRFGGTAIIGFICSLLIAGKFTHHVFQRRGLVFGIIIPPAIISGLLGLIWFLIIGSVDEKLALDLSDGLEVVRVNLVNFVFGALILGLSCSRRSSQHDLRGIVTSAFHEGMPMIIYSQILIWGQSTCSLFVLCLCNAFGAKIPNLFAAMVPLGVEAGNDVSAVPVGKEFWSQTVVEEAESLGMMSICFVGIFLINIKPYFIARGWLGQKYSRDSMLSASTGHAEAFDRSSNTKKRSAFSRAMSVGDLKNISMSGLITDTEDNVNIQEGDEQDYIGDKIDDDKSGSASLGAHISLIALTVFISFGISLLGREIEIYMGFTNRIFSGVRMFKLSMCCALISMHFILKTSRIRFRRDWFMRLCGLMLDLICIAALSNSLPKPKNLETTHYQICFFFVMINLAWNAFCFIFVARQLFPNFWFERSLVLSCDALGHCYTGLLFARTLDPSMESPVPAAYAYKLMLFFIPASGGKNSIVVLMTTHHGPVTAFVVCLCVVTTWIIIFETYFKHRFVSYKDKDADSEIGSNSSNRRSSVDVNIEKEPLLYALSFDNHEDNLEKKVMKNSDSNLQQNIDNESPLSRRHSMGSSLTPRKVESSEPSLIISPEQMNLVASWLPAARSIRNWNLKYSLRRDGALMSTLMSQCVPKRRNGLIEQTSYVVIIEDSWGYVSGGFISNALENRTSYYGNGESFVFKVAPDPEVFRWTKANNFFIISNESMLAMGGGNEGYAFQLDDELDTGVSNRSGTFNNDGLFSSEFFKCLNVEMWELDDIGFSV